MYSKVFCASLFACAVISSISDNLQLCEGRKHVRQRYYPEEPPVKTLLLENGDVVDCVDFYSQPAMRNPHVRKLYKYELQSRARLPPRETVTEIESHGSLSDNIRGIGLKEGSCPSGSVPFLKATKSGPLNYSAIDNFARSRAKLFRMRSNSIQDDNDHDRNVEHEYAVAEISRGSYGGAKGSFNVWKPFVEQLIEGSISQMWLTQKHIDNVASLETGWIVHYPLFRDHNVRFFCFTTSDTYRTWLYNAGRRSSVDNGLVFHQLSSRVFPGGIIRRISVFGGQQKEIHLEIKKDLETGNWNLFYYGEIVGFWPKENYNWDFNQADTIQWGGEIFNNHAGGRHTRTQMGNGHFGSEEMGNAAYIQQMEVYDLNLVPFHPAYNLQLHITHPSCYDIKDWGTTSLGRMVTFGGPGYNGLLCV